MQPLIDGKSIDREIAEETPCEECGSAMKYEARFGTFSGEKSEYHAWAVCTNEDCDNEFEF